MFYYDPLRSPSLEDYRLTIEYKHLKHNAPGGVFVIPSLHQLRLWYGVIFVRRGHYASGVFKFRVELPADYNDVGTWPVIRFTSTVFNPMVSATTGVVDLKHAFPEWIPAKQHYMVAALTQVKKIFYMKEFPYPQVPNPEAQALFQNDKRAFLERVENCVRESQEHIYDNEEGSSLRFTEPKPAHDKLRERILGAEREESLSPVRPSKANAQEVPLTTTEDLGERDGVGPESESHSGR